MDLQKRTVYVRGLEDDTNAEKLEKIFKDVGAIQKSVLCRTSSGVFEGKAYITFADETTAKQAAIQHSKDGLTVQAVTDPYLAEMQLLLGDGQQEHILEALHSMSDEMRTVLLAQLLKATPAKEESVVSAYKQEPGATSTAPSNPLLASKSVTVPVPASASISQPYGIVMQEAPKICVFSGHPGKDSSFGKWKYDVMCVKEELDDSKHTLSTALSAVRKSLRSPASDIITHLGKEADLDTIISKLKSVYGTVYSGQTLLQKFYAGTQKDESCGQWACRLECLAYDAEEKKMVTRSAVSGMLKAQFWAGLKDPRIKCALCYRKNEISFEDLVIEAREIEEEYKSDSEEAEVSKVKLKAKVQQTKPSEMEELLTQMKQISMRMEKVEGQLNRPQSSQQSRPRRREGPMKCDRCQMEGHLSFGCRQGTSVTCYKCGQPGHISRSCRSSSQPLNPQ
jgi:hypothetical protein